MITAAELAQLPERPERQTTTFRTSRPDSLESRFLILLPRPVQKGFGRGSKELGCPIANLPDKCITPPCSVVKTGDGCRPRTARLSSARMVMSLQWNPFYKNGRLTVEIHIIHEFWADFYGCKMNAWDYTSREALIQDIEVDKRVAINSLKRPAYKKILILIFPAL
ncbi:hypothetical protein K438DRAFT_1908390 [Mycena galopus ATCC 62051]|nr:hypothetical protein K438DRAFT_1908390 [Mycena galopus ATCC 62051]